MSATVSTVHAGAHGHAEDRPRINALGLWLFIFSETCLFLAFIAARYLLAGLERPAELKLLLGVGLTVILVASSGSAYAARRAMADGDRGRASAFLLVTIALGLLFVAGVAVEWSSAGFGLDSAFGTTFFSATGLHLMHVISSVVVLALLLRLLRRGHFSATDHWGVDAVVRYWTFVDAVWVVLIFPTFYLL